MREQGFHVWIRASDSGVPRYDLRFEAAAGQGALRVARPGVLATAEPSVDGEVEGLSGAQLRRSRFLHLWEEGTRRQGHTFSGLDDSVLSDLEAGSWVPLIARSQGRWRVLVPGTRAEEPEFVADDDTDTELDPAAEKVDPSAGLSTERPEPVHHARGPGLAEVPLAGSSQATVLVRMLRRQAMDDAVEIRELRARVAALTAELAAQKGRNR